MDGQDDETKLLTLYHQAIARRLQQKIEMPLQMRSVVPRRPPLMRYHPLPQVLPTIQEGAEEEQAESSKVTKRPERNVLYIIRL